MSSPTPLHARTGGPFARLGAWCVRRRGRVVVAWLVVLVGLGVLQGAVGSDLRSDFDLPDVQSREGFELLDEHFAGVGAGESGRIVMRSASGFEDPAVREPLIGFLDAVAALPDARVESPFTPEGAFRVSAAGPAAGTIAYAEVELPDDVEAEAQEEFAAEVFELADGLEGTGASGVQVEFGGYLFAEFEPPSAELIGLGFAIVILILAFGSVLAMGLPIAVALGGIGVGASLLLLLSNVTAMPDFATTLGVMIGLGVGIDYALFIVTRYREQLRTGADVESASAVAIDTSGRAVLFAALTVVVSLLGMLLMGVSFVNGLAIGAATIVTVTMVASLTLLPALLGFAGARIEVTRWRGLVAAGCVAVALVGAGLEVQPLLVGLPLAIVVLAVGSVLAPLRRTVPERAHRPLEQTRAWRWSRFVQGRPVVVAVGATVLLLVLAAPVADLRLGFSDEGNAAPESTSRKAYDLVATGFGPGANGPLILVAELPDGAEPAALAAVTDAVAATDGVAWSTPAVPNDPEAPTAVLWQVIPETAPQSEETTALVKDLRSRVLPSASGGIDVLVTGFVAVTVDFSDYLATRLPLFFGAVLSVSFLLLLLVFRSVLVPLKAVVMNLLSIGAAYGLTVAVFQWGWGGGLLGIEAAPVEPFLPMMLFAIVFGLSMDYEVFLLSRIREEWVRTGDSRTSVADGLAATAAVITAAAAIMVVVFGSFILETDRVVRLMGFGLAVAVFLDATVVRMLLVPATMELLGDRNWWLPVWLDRLLPRIDVEGSSSPPTPGDEGGDSDSGGGGGGNRTPDAGQPEPELV